MSPADAAIDEAALDWFVRRRDPAFKAADEAAFERWRAASPRHDEAYTRWAGEWRALDAIAPADRARLAAVPLPSTAEAAFNPRRRRLLVPALPALGLLAVLGGAGKLGWDHWQATPVFTRRYDTPRGQFAELLLPDGSKLLLDSATRVEVVFYRSRRALHLLEGQAVFDVRADPKRPFQVLAGPLSATAVGTRFSVRQVPTLAGAVTARVAVEEGTVRVEHPAAAAGPSVQHSVLLSAGQQVGVDAGGELSPISGVADGGIAPWRSYRVAFDNQRLDEALAELGRYRAPGLQVRDPAVAALSITGVFDPRDPVTFGRLLTASLPVRLRDLGDGQAEVVLRR